MTFHPVHWRSTCDHNFGGWHLWMCYAHNKGWKQLAVFCSRCGVKSYMSDRQWDIYYRAREKGEQAGVSSKRGR